jgi:solute carrier family 8 (sodium/calcium exchanger)
MNLIERILCFRVETIDGSAVGGEDFVTFNQVIQFEPNEVEKQVSSKRKSILLY